MINQASTSQSNLENFVIIWLDTTINLTDNSTQVSVNYLRHTIGFVVIFDDPDKCVDYITDVKDKRLFLIISGSLNIDIRPLIDQVQQLQAIYIFCSSTDNYEQWPKQYLKIHGVYSDISSICRQLKRDIAQSSNDFIAIQSIPSAFDNNKLPASFMYSQIVRDILLQMNNDTTAKQEMIEFCRQYYATDGHILRSIDQFDLNYQSDLAIQWYTRERFPHEILNRALRCQNIDILYQIRFFIKDLHKQLENLYSSRMNRPNTNILYRGQAITKDEFLRLKPDRLLSFSSFLSTTIDREVAEMFIGSEQDKLGVLFEIKSDANCLTYDTPFAYIHNLSQVPDEDEVLFSMGAIFRIISIDKMDEKPGCYRVQLVITDAEDKELKELKANINNEIDDHNGVFYLASLARIMGRYSAALKFYDILLDDSSLQVDDPVRLSIIYNDIGSVYQEQKNYTKALELYQKSLEIKKAHDKNIAVVCNNIAVVYCQLGMTDEVLIYLETALKSDKNTPQNYHKLDRQRLADNYSIMAGVYKEKGDYSKALEYFQMAQQIENELLLPGHPEHLHTYKNIGGIYFKQSKYDEALNNFQKALEIQIKTQDHQHPRSIELYDSIAETYRAQENYDPALLYYEKALHAATQSLPLDVSFIAMTYKNIGDMHSNQKRHEKAVEFFSKSLDITLNPQIDDEELIALLYASLAMSLHALERFKESSENMEKCVQILLKIASPNDPHLKNIIANTEMLRKM